jgi:hypothetical protein
VAGTMRRDWDKKDVVRMKIRRGVGCGGKGGLVLVRRAYHVGLVLDEGSGWWLVGRMGGEGSLTSKDRRVVVHEKSSILSERLCQGLMAVFVGWRLEG